MGDDLSYIAEALRPLAVPLAELHEDPANSRTKHAVDRIAASLKTYGQRKPIVANRRQGGKVEAGNGTLKAARSLGWTHLAVVWMDDDPATAAAYGIADNRLGELSEWDVDALAANVQSVGDLLTGFTPAELSDLLPAAEPEGEDPGAQVDKAEELSAKWQVTTGDLWQLGEHRLVCGDCTDAAVVGRVMGGEKAVLLITDPPYGIDHHNDVIPTNNHKKHAGIANDERDAEEFCDRFVRSLESFDGTFFIFGAYVQFPVWYKRLNEWHKVNQVLIWEKDNAVLSRLHYNLKFEMIYHGYKSSGVWHGDNTQDDVLEYRNVNSFGYRKDDGTRNAMNDAQVHPHQKPMDMICDFIILASNDNDVVLEPFLGSGTTLIACERLGRKCRAIEIEPKYCAVALERWATMTGKAPVRVNDGRETTEANG